MATDGRMMVLYDVDLPFGKEMVEIAKGVLGYYIVPADVKLQPIAVDYKAAIPKYPDEAVTSFELGGRVQNDRQEITELIVKYQLNVNYTYFEKLRKYPALWELFLPLERLNDETTFPIMCKSEEHKLTVVMMPFIPSRRY